VLAANVETQVMRAWQTTNVTFGTAASDYGGKLGVVPNTTPGSAADAKQISVGEASGNVLYRMQLGYAFFAAQHRGTISVYGGGIIAALHINEGGGAIFTPGGGGVGAVETGYEGYLYYNSIEVGWKDLGAIVEYKRGQCCVLFGNFTIPSMAQNALVSVYNEAGGPITLTPTGGLTLRLGGTALTGARTLANKGLVSVWYRTPTEAIIQGSGLT